MTDPARLAGMAALEPGAAIKRELAEALARNLALTPHIQPGWRSLYAQMCRDLVAARDPAVVRGTTEKFAGLRIEFVGALTEVGVAIVAAAEGASRGVCEACGAPARPARRGGWWRTRCAAHVDWSLEATGTGQ